jgi:hypothetical protein
MERTQVKSSSIRSVGYDPAAKILEVEFASGAIYRHHDVPPEIYVDLLSAESVGKFYGANLRGKFQYAKATNA